MEVFYAKLHGTDGCAHGDVLDVQFRISLLIHVVQDGSHDAGLKARKPDGIILTERGWQQMLAGLQQFFVDICLKAHMAAVVTAVLLAEICLPIYIRVAVGIQRIMPEESGYIGFGNPAFLWFLEELSAVQQVF